MMTLSPFYACLEAKFERQTQSRVGAVIYYSLGRTSPTCLRHWRVVRCNFGLEEVFSFSDMNRRVKNLMS